jgi:hypothetical protein
MVPNLRSLGGRREKRNSAKVKLQIRKPQEPSSMAEVVSTENLSPSGVRVLSTTAWKPGEHLCIRASLGGSETRALVVYCRPLETRKFALGIELLSSVVQTESWLEST